MAISLGDIKTGKQTRAPRIVVLGVEKIGKEQPVSAPVLTESGWRPIGEVEVDDKLYGRDGKLHTCIGVYPQGEKTVYQVQFSDGTMARCGIEHLWDVQTQKLREKREWKTISLREIVDGGYLKASGDAKYNIPMNDCIDFPVRNVEICSYFLGLLLGNGRFTLRNENELIRRLSNYGLYGKKSSEKFIPKDFIYNDKRIRLNVLSGIVNTDGSIVNGKAIMVSTYSPWMAADIANVARSLGFRAKVSKYMRAVDEFEFHVRINGDIRKLRLSEKHQSKLNPGEYFHSLKTIKAIDPEVKQEESVCIMLDGAEHLYITNGYTVTHNTTFSCGTRFENGKIAETGMNNPIVIPTKGEEGTDALDVPVFPTCPTLENLMEAIGALYAEEHDYKSVVLDSASALEPLIWDAICNEYKVDSIEKVGGGYGKGYTEAVSRWRQILDGLDALRATKNMASIIIGHVKVKRFDDPAGDSYDQYQFDIHDKSANVLFRWADLILFANTKVVVKKEDAGFGKEKKRGIDNTGGQRFLYTHKKPAHPGGGRGIYGQLPYELPLDWAAFENAVATAMEQGE